MNRRTILQSVLAIPALLVGKVFGAKPVLVFAGGPGRQGWKGQNPMKPNTSDVAPIPMMPIPAKIAREMDLIRRSMEDINSLRAGYVRQYPPLTEAERAEVATWVEGPEEPFFGEIE